MYVSSISVAPMPSIVVFVMSVRSSLPLPWAKEHSACIDDASTIIIDMMRLFFIWEKAKLSCCVLTRLGLG